MGSDQGTDVSSDGRLFPRLPPWWVGPVSVSSAPQPLVFRSNCMQVERPRFCFILVMSPPSLDDLTAAGDCDWVVGAHSASVVLLSPLWSGSPGRAVAELGPRSGVSLSSSTTRA